MTGKSLSLQVILNFARFWTSKQNNVGGKIVYIRTNIIYILKARTEVMVKRPKIDRDPIELLVRKLDNPELITTLHQEQFDELYDLLNHTVSTGGSNSVLVLGPRGVGKSNMINRVLEKIKTDSSVFRTDGMIVYLSGIVQTDDKLALKEITHQLNLENVISQDKVFGSFAQHLEFLLASLRAGKSRTSRPIVFLLEDFELFCLHHNQTLLYNLFDIAQTKAAPIIVVGVSPHFDVVESLEKRVKSRFNHRQLIMLPHQTFDQYYDAVKEILNHPDIDPEWSRSTKDTLKSTQAKKLFKAIYATNNTIGYLKQFLVTAFSLLDPHEAITFRHLSDVFDSQSEPAAEKRLIEGLSVLEVCVLVAVNHVMAIYQDQPFNFEMAYHEYDKFATRKAKMFRYDRSVVMKAWEALQDLELITPVDRGTKIQKEFKLFTLQVLPDQILAVVDSNLPLTVKEWATSVTFQD